MLTCLLPPRTRGRHGGGDVDAEDAARQRCGDGVHPRAEVRRDRVAFALEVLVGLLQCRRNLLLSTAALFFDDRAALRTSLIANSRCLESGIGHRLLVILLRGSE